MSPPRRLPRLLSVLQHSVSRPGVATSTAADSLSLRTSDLRYRHEGCVRAEPGRPRSATRHGILRHCSVVVKLRRNKTRCSRGGPSTYPCGVRSGQRADPHADWLLSLPLGVGHSCLGVGHGDKPVLGACAELAQTYLVGLCRYGKWATSRDIAGSPRLAANQPPPVTTGASPEALILPGR